MTGALVVAWTVTGCGTTASQVARHCSTDARDTSAAMYRTVEAPNTMYCTPRCPKGLVFEIASFPHKVPRAALLEGGTEITVRAANNGDSPVWLLTAQRFPGTSIEIRRANGEALRSRYLVLNAWPKCSRFAVLQPGKSLEYRLVLLDVPEVRVGELLSVRAVYHDYSKVLPPESVTAFPVQGQIESNTVEIEVTE
ncbi:MAG TPA: hypothetical protein VIV60_33735 [Polyangiaceae bacterium]